MFFYSLEIYVIVIRRTTLKALFLTCNSVKPGHLTLSCRTVAFNSILFTV